MDERFSRTAALIGEKSVGSIDIIANDKVSRLNLWILFKRIAKSMLIL